MKKYDEIGRKYHEENAPFYIERETSKIPSPPGTHQLYTCYIHFFQDQEKFRSPPLLGLTLKKHGTFSLCLALARHFLNFFSTLHLFDKIRQPCFIDSPPPVFVNFWPKMMRMSVGHQFYLNISSSKFTKIGGKEGRKMVDIRQHEK